MKEPSEALARREEVEGSKEMADEFWKRSRPAKVPASPTIPMRSKSTCGRMAKTRFA